MLLAQRKRKQQLTGKIGHTDEEYEFGDQRRLGMQIGARDGRLMHGGYEVIPPWGKQEPQQRHRQRTPAPQQTPQQQPLQIYQPQPWAQENVSPPLNPWVNPSPWQNNANCFHGDRYQKPLSFPSVLPPLHAAPLLPSPAIVGKSPLRFPSALKAADINATPQLPLRPFSAQSPAPLPLQVPQLPMHMLPPVLPPMPQPITPSRSESRYGIRPRSQPSTSAGSLFPQVNDNPISARRQARQRAIEIQNENARLCEERRLRRELQRQAEMEEQRRQEEIAREQRVYIGRKERDEMERERYEAEEKMMGRRPNKKDRSSEAQLREDLKRQIEEKKRRQEEEERREADRESKRTLGTATNAPLMPLESNTNISASVEKKDDLSLPQPLPVQLEPPLQQPTGFVQPLFNPVVGANPPLMQTQLPPPFSVDLLSCGLPFQNGGMPLPPFDAMPPPPPPPPFAPVTPLATAAAAAGGDISLGIGNPSVLPVPCPTTPREVPHTRDAERLESQLREMVNNHRGIQRMLETEVQRKPGEALPAPLPLPSPIVMPQSYLPSLNPLQPPPTPVVFQTSNACGGGLPAASEALPSGILRRSCEQQQQPGRIVVLGVNPPAAAAQGLLSPTLLSADFGELSAEPSKFIGPVPFVK